MTVRSQKIKFVTLTRGGDNRGKKWGDFKESLTELNITKQRNFELWWWYKHL